MSKMTIFQILNHKMIYQMRVWILKWILKMERTNLKVLENKA